MLYSWASGKPLLGRLRRDSLRPQPDIPIAFQAPVEILPIPALDGPQTGTPAVVVSAQKRLNQVASLKEDSRRTFYCFSKRCIDVGLAGLALVLLLPLLLLIAVLIKLDSPGPVLFTHERVGAKRQRGSREAVWAVQQFGMHKFRSMFQNADSRVHEAYIRDFVEGRVRPNTESGGKFKLTNDPRVTRVGRFLRRTSLDELPQLFNVLKGQMSLVGPRPVPPYEVACYRNGEHKRLAALPGITGLWQVKGRCRVSFEEMIRMDIEYVQSASLWLDLQILFLTVPAVLCGRGAE